MKRLDTSSDDFDLSLQSLLSSSDEPDQSVVETVTQVIADVRSRGDAALLEYTNRSIDVLPILSHWKFLNKI